MQTTHHHHIYISGTKPVAVVHHNQYYPICYDSDYSVACTTDHPEPAAGRRPASRRRRLRSRRV